MEAGAEQKRLRPPGEGLAPGESAELRLARLGRQNQLILDSADEGICGIDADGRVTFANPAAARLLGFDPTELPGRELHDVLHGNAAAGSLHDPADCPITSALDGHVTRARGDEFFWRPDGTGFPVEYTATPIVLDDALEGAVIAFRDISERRRAQSQVEYLADHDMLTGLYNRRRFSEELQRHIELAERYEVRSAVLVLDLDNFKYVNDALGPGVGDQVIAALGSRIAAHLRSSDIAARIGGDEFAVVLPGCDARAAQRAARELRELVREHTIRARQKPLRMTTSIGITVIDRAGIGSEQLLMEADVALHEAKEAGRDRAVHFFRGSDERPGAHASFVWIDRIKRALEEDRLIAYGQPIVPMDGGSVPRYELLVRMWDELGNVVAPDAFLPVAERFGLIGEIDSWMVRKATSIIRREQDAGRSVVLELNLSGRSIADPALLEVIERELERTGIDPSSLVFEITETVAISNMDEARRLAERIRRLGSRFALDDFGAGFGSFLYLKHLPLDYLKIDGEFIRNLDRSAVDQRMVRAMVEVARGLGLQTIAEFVESAPILRRLGEFGIDFAQGHHLGRPQPIEDLLAVRAIKDARTLAPPKTD